jgi:hypothetical protein
MCVCVGHVTVLLWLLLSLQLMPRVDAAVEQHSATGKTSRGWVVPFIVLIIAVCSAALLRLTWASVGIK